MAALHISEARRGQRRVSVTYFVIGSHLESSYWELSSKNRWSLSSGRPWCGEKMVLWESCLFCTKESPMAEVKQRQTPLGHQFGVIHGDLPAPFFS